MLEAALAEKSDVIGLSGLISAALDEMAHVAHEMERLGYSIPLLIGGATTSKAHTAVKIAPHYSGPTIHVLDASRAVNVVASLVSQELRKEFVSKNQKEQDHLRDEFHRRTAEKQLLTIEEARRRKLVFDWEKTPIDKPSFLGLRAIANQPLDELVPYIDWSPFFHTWELRGRYPKIFDDPEVGEQARQLYEDAQKLLQDIVNSRLLVAKAAYGFSRPNRKGDHIAIYADETRSDSESTLHPLRHQI